MHCYHNQNAKHEPSIGARLFRVNQEWSGQLNIADWLPKEVANEVKRGAYTKVLTS